MLALKDVSKRFASADGEVRALQDVSLTLDAGEFLTVRGPSGSGKSTLLLVAGSLLKPTTGLVTLDGVDPYSLGRDQRAGFRADRVGFVFQQFHLVGYLTVRENILSAALGAASPADENRCDELMDHFGLTGRARHRPGKLSVGEKQRTALARALLNRPKLLLADEPTGNLDHDNARVVLQAMRRFADEGGAVLLVTHDQRATDFATRRAELVAGVLTPAAAATV